MQIKREIVFKLEMDPADDVTKNDLVPDFNDSNISLKKSKLLNEIDKKVRRLLGDGFDHQQPVKGLKIGFKTYIGGHINNVEVTYDFKREYTPEVEAKLIQATEMIADEFIKNFTMHFSYPAYNLKRYSGVVRTTDYMVK